MSGTHLLTQWSRTQHVISLSSGEAELHAVCTCASEGLALRNISAEMGLDAELELLTDSSAAKGIVMRNGAGRVKHLDIKSLWIQEREARGDLRVKKVPRLANWSDLLTHHWSEQEGRRHLDGMAVHRRSRPRPETHGPPPRGGVQICTPWNECDSIQLIEVEGRQGERRASVRPPAGMIKGERLRQRPTPLRLDVGTVDAPASHPYRARVYCKSLLHLAQGAFGLRDCW